MWAAHKRFLKFFNWGNVKEITQKANFPNSALLYIHVDFERATGCPNSLLEMMANGTEPIRKAATASRNKVMMSIRESGSGRVPENKPPC